MFGLSKREKYEASVLARISELLSQHDGNFSRTFYASYPGARSAIDKGFQEQRNKVDLSLNVANAVLVDVIEKRPDTEWQERTFRQLQERIGHPDYRWRRTVEQVREGRYPKNIDNFVYVLEWFLAMTAKANEEGHIDDDTVNILSNEIAGALAGKNAEQRQGQRLADALLRFYG